MKRSETREKELAVVLENLLKRLTKFIDRRVPDDGPDLEFSKLDDAMRAARRVLKEISS
jgi:hypothetical protein